MSKPYQHVRIPLSLILDSPGIKASTIAVYVALASFADVNGVAWPSIKTTAMRAKVSQATVRKEIHRLESFGLLIIKPRSEIISGKPVSTSHLYTLTWHKKYLKNQNKILEDSDLNQELSNRDTSPTTKGERRTTTTTNDNHLNHTSARAEAQALVTRCWSSIGSTQSQKDIATIVEISIANGIPIEQLEKAFKRIAESGAAYISKFTLSQAMKDSLPKGTLRADVKVEWPEGEDF